MFPVAVSKSHGCPPGHTTAPHTQAHLEDKERTLFALAGPGARASCFPFLFAVLVPPLDPRLIPGRERLHGDNGLVCTLSSIHILFLFLMVFFRLTFCERVEYPHREVT